MRKHLLYYPIGHSLYRSADRAMTFLGINRGVAALVFPNALCGSLSVVLSYLLFLRFIRQRREAAILAAVYAFTYSVWINASITESYALTAFCVNVFLYAVIRERVEPSWRWCCGMVTLIGLCALCDLRSLFLLAVPFYIIIRAPGINRHDRCGYILFLIMGALGIVLAAYEIYGIVSGQACFGVRVTYTWLLGYGHKFTAETTTGSRYTLFSFLVQSLSPLYQEQLAQLPSATMRAHNVLSDCFITLWVFLAATSWQSIVRALRLWKGLQGLACWIAIYLLYHLFYSPWSAILFAPPLVLPLLLITLPAIVTTWTASRSSAWILMPTLAVMLGNNLIVINEARLAWQRPDILQSPSDRIYLLPGEIERMYFLMQKGLLGLPDDARSKFAEQKTRPYAALGDRERAEFAQFVQGAYGRLPELERRELLDIQRRYLEAVRLSPQRQLTK